MRLIDADALKKILCEEYEAREHYIGEIMLNAIDNAPTVIWCSETSEGYPLMDLRPREEGEWIPQGGGFSWVFKCSCCSWVDGYPLNARHKYCPNCGADMRGKEK